MKKFNLKVIAEGRWHEFQTYLLGVFDLEKCKIEAFFSTDDDKSGLIIVYLDSDGIRIPDKWRYSNTEASSNIGELIVNTAPIEEVKHSSFYNHYLPIYDSLVSLMQQNEPIALMWNELKKGNSNELS